MDYTIFRGLNDLAGRSHLFDVLVRQIATKALLLAPLVLLIVWVAPGKEPDRARTAVIAAACAAAIALGINYLIAHLYYRPRPFLAHHVHQLIPHGKESSFPSDHSAIAFAIASALWPWRRWIAAVLGALALSIALSRVIAGVHYPGDVAGGGAIGIFSAIVVWTIARPPVAWLARHLQRFWETLTRPLRRTASTTPA